MHKTVLGIAAAEAPVTQKIKIGGIIQNDQLASVSVLAVKDRPGIAAAVMDALGQRAINVQFVVQVIDQSQQAQMVLCIDRTDLPASLDAIEEIRPELQPAAVTSRPDVASIAIFGPDFRERPGIAGQMFRTLAAKGVNILAISTSISTVNCIIELSRLHQALAGINEQFDLP
jgi:aspartate kinase